MLKRTLVVLGILAAVAALADRGLAVVAGNATATQIKRHEGLREDPDVTFRGFPFVTQALRGEFRRVDVTVRDLERRGVPIDRIDATLEGVEVDISEAVNGRVSAVPVREGTATLRLAYGDLQSYLASKPGNIRIAARDGQVFVASTYGIAGVGQVEVEGTPEVRVTPTSIRVTVTNVRATSGGTTLTAAVARAASARSSFTIPLDDLPFGIEVRSAELTASALVVTASARGLVIDVGKGTG